MTRFRFSIASLLGLVVFLAVALAALRESTYPWDSALLALTLLVLLTSVLWAVHRTDRRRAYWLGVALFGWAYLRASLVPQVRQRMLTTKFDFCPFYRPIRRGAQRDHGRVPNEAREPFSGLSLCPGGRRQAAGASPRSRISRNGPLTFEKAPR
jgi:hypothetical protein